MAGLFFESDTTGEKDFEGFYTNQEQINWDRFKALGVIENSHKFDTNLLKNFENTVHDWIATGDYDRSSIIKLFNATVENFNHSETVNFR